MKTALFIEVTAFALVLSSGYVGSGMAVMGGTGHGGGGMTGHSGAGREGHGGGGEWFGSTMGPGSMAHHGGSMPGADSGPGYQGMTPDSGRSTDGDGHGHGSSDVQGSVDTQHNHGDEAEEMSDH